MNIRENKQRDIYNRVNELYMKEEGYSLEKSCNELNISKQTYYNYKKKFLEENVSNTHSERRKHSIQKPIKNYKSTTIELIPSSSQNPRQRSSKRDTVNKKITPRDFQELQRDLRSQMIKNGIDN